MDALLYFDDGGDKGLLKKFCRIHDYTLEMLDCKRKNPNETDFKVTSPDFVQGSFYIDEEHIQDNDWSYIKTNNNFFAEILTNTQTLDNEKSYENGINFWFSLTSFLCSELRGDVIMWLEWTPTLLLKIRDEIFIDESIFNEKQYSKALKNFDNLNYNIINIEKRFN